MKDRIIPVQIRPVPTLSPDRKVKNLGKVPKGQVVLAETPFVQGSFREEGRLVRPHYKNDYPGHELKEPVILWNTESDKGFRFLGDKNARGLFNPREGSALTHGEELIPPFGQWRDSWVSIGVPKEGLENALRGVMQVREEHVGIDTDHTGKFSYTPFTITIESDGRNGRVLVPEGTLEILEEARKKLEEQRKKDTELLERINAMPDPKEFLKTLDPSTLVRLGFPAHSSRTYEPPNEVPF